MAIQITPIVSASTKKGLIGFKVRGKDKGVLQAIRNKIKRWCEKQGIEIDEGW